MDQQILRMIQLLGVHDIIRTCHLCQHTLILTLTTDAITAFGLPMHAHHAGVYTTWLYYDTKYKFSYTTVYSILAVVQDLRILICGLLSLRNLYLDLHPHALLVKYSMYIASYMPTSVANNNLWTCTLQQL